MLILASPVSAQFYRQVNLVSDISGMAAVTDPLLVNPWGMSSSPMSPLWTSNQVSGTATLYSIDGVTGAVTKVPLNVTIPGPPTGQLFNGSPNFVVSSGGASGPALFIFAALNGTISGWNPGVPPPPRSTHAILAATGSPAPVAYTGLTWAVRGSDPFLYAANNATGHIDVYNKTYTKAAVPGTFTDPALPAGDLAFNVVNIGGNLFVTYSGPTGVVNVFDPDGHFVKRFATGGTLVNPWGIAVAPDGFGEFSNAVLIGNFNFGDPSKGPGSISAFDFSTGAFLGRLEDTAGTPISIDGLWALKFGNGQKGGISNVLYFTAGIQKQTHGLLGRLAACGVTLSDVSASPNVLWPPNHKMVPVAINYDAADDCDPAPVCSLSVTSNEGEGGGSGHTSPDWMVIDAHHESLRAERAGSGSGRVYTTTISCQDKLGLTAGAAVDVVVPHNPGKK
ncbi:MAG TPA: TIGR03118 family protein [Bryobacteraceae bacterium]|nr:TIGR03118 family protein [Bryobacteraceae bacterium]